MKRSLLRPLGIAQRITILWAALFAFGLAAFALFAWIGIVREQYEALDADLLATAAVTSERAALEMGLRAVALGSSDAPGTGIVILRGRLQVASSGVPVPPGLLASFSTLPFHQGVSLKASGGYRAVALPVGGRSGERIVVFAPTSILQDEQHRSAYGFGVAAVPILFFAIAAGVLLAKRSLAPIEDMRRIAVEIARSRSLKTRLHVDGNDELSRLAGTFDDMLDRIERSFERERSFIGDVSHELRNSLAAIIAESDFALLRDRDTAAYSQALVAVVSRARRLASVVDDLLLLARADAGALPASETVDLNDVVARVCADVQNRTPGGPISVELSDEPVTVLARKELIARAVENLVVNARHVARNHVRLRVSLEDGFALVRVEDDGPGVPGHDREKLFRRFERGIVEYAGSGLGLPLVAAIARAYSGAVAVESNAWNGASFVLKLPRRLDAVIDSSSSGDTIVSPDRGG